jgi:hypothetical protein
MNEKWLGATITGPSGGIFCVSIARVRKSSSRIGVSTSRTTSYMRSGTCVRVRSWKRVKYSAGRGSL